MTRGNPVKRRARRRRLVLMQNSGTVPSSASGGGNISTGGGEHAPRPRREEDLTEEELAIMAACEADETWNALRRLRPDAKQKFLSAACVLIQEIVEDNGLAERFRGWAMRWGDDDPDACRLLREVYNMLGRHIMGITASQFVWQERGENETAQKCATPSGEHSLSSKEGDDDALVERGEANTGGESTPLL